MALGVRLLALALRDTPPNMSENLNAGFTLATHGYLGDPFIVRTGPSAHVAPAYPAVAAVIRWLSPDEPRARWYLKLLAACLSSLNAALLVTTASRLGFSLGAGLIAAAMWVLPVFAWIELSGEHEAVLTTLAMLLLVRLYATQWRANRWTPRSGALAGAAVGLAAHVNPVLLAMTAFMGVAAVVAGRVHLRRAAAYAGAATVSALAVLAPYTARNVVTMKGLFLVRDNLGIELHASNNARSAASAHDNLAPGRGMDGHPSIDAAAAVRLSQLGEVEYNRRLLDSAFTWIRSNPSAFAALSLERAIRVILPASPRMSQRLLLWTTLSLFMAGIALGLMGVNVFGAAILFAGVAGFDLIYVTIQHDVRYVYPGLMLQTLLGAAAVSSVASRIRNAASGAVSTV